MKKECFLLLLLRSNTWFNLNDPTARIARQSMFETLMVCLVVSRAEIINANCIPRFAIFYNFSFQPVTWHFEIMRYVRTKRFPCTVIYAPATKSHPKNNKQHSFSNRVSQSNEKKSNNLQTINDINKFGWWQQITRPRITTFLCEKKKQSVIFTILIFIKLQPVSIAFAGFVIFIRKKNREDNKNLKRERKEEENEELEKI